MIIPSRPPRFDRSRPLLRPLPPSPLEGLVPAAASVLLGLAVVLFGALVVLRLFFY